MPAPAPGTLAALRGFRTVMIDAIANFIEWKSKTKPTRPEARVAPKAPPQPAAEPRDQRFGFTKVFRWPVPTEQTPPPTTVEVVGSFNEWRKIPLSYNSPSRTWQLILNNIQGNHTHRYVILVDGKPSYDKTCDGLTAPQSPNEAQWQIETPKGPRVMLLFSQTK